MRALVLLALAVAIASADTITWTGIAEDNQWTNHINWNPDKVPGPNDDVVINSGVVQVTVPIVINSLNMGTEFSANANLTIFQSFFVSNGMTVQGNGILNINTGLQTVAASATINGQLNFIDGVLSGNWLVSGKYSSANLGNANEKGFSACNFTTQGPLTLAGVIALNQSSVFNLESATTVNTNLIIQNGDNSNPLFNAAGAVFTYSNGVLTIQAPVQLGVFNLVSGNITILDSLTFTQALNVPANSFVNCFGNAVLNATTGFTGMGVVSVGCTTTTIGASSLAVFNIIGGDVAFVSQSDFGILTISGGNAIFSANVYPKQFNLLSGTTASLSGTTIAANLYVSTKGFSLNSAVTANATATFMTSILSFGAQAAITISSDAKASALGALLLTGPPSVPGVTNNGEFAAVAAVSSQNINIQGSGTFNVSNKLNLGTATFTQKSVNLGTGATFFGQNSFLTVGKIANAQGGAVKAVIGDYTFQCPDACDNVVTPGTNAPTSTFSFSA